MVCSCPVQILTEEIGVIDNSIEGVAGVEVEALQAGEETILLLLHRFSFIRVLFSSKEEEFIEGITVDIVLVEVMVTDVQSLVETGGMAIGVMETRTETAMRSRDIHKEELTTTKMTTRTSSLFLMPSKL